MFGWTKAYWSRQRDLEEITAMSDSELSDIGASRADLRRIVEMPDEVPTRMASMARIFGISEDRLAENRAEYVERLMNCAACRALGECRHELAKGDGADPAVCGTFCPNAGRFAELSRAV